MSRYTQKLHEIGVARNTSATAEVTRGIKFNRHQLRYLRELAVGAEAPTIEAILVQYPTFSKAKAGLAIRYAKQVRKQLATVLGVTDVKGIQNPQAYGVVYLITNAKFEGWVKCGMTSNLKKRLASYNLYDPTESFEIAISKAVADRKSVETRLIKELQLASKVCKGEWFYVGITTAIQLFNKVVSHSKECV